MIINCAAMMEACPVECENPWTHEIRQVHVPIGDVFNAFDYNGSDIIEPMQAQPSEYEYDAPDVPSS